LTGFDYLAGSRQLKQHCVGFCLIAGPGRTNAKLQIRVGKNALGFESVFADDVRNLNFRTAQGEIDRGCDPEEKNNRYRDDDSDAAKNG
jgi:hypothetical protein